MGLSCSCAEEVPADRLNVGKMFYHDILELARCHEVDRTNAQFVRSVRQLKQLVISRMSAKEMAASGELVQKTLCELEETSTVVTSSIGDGSAVGGL